MRRPWLAPFNPLYAAGLSIRNFRLAHNWEPVQRLRKPVISIGNLSTGGSGKTPLTIALAKALTQRGLHVDVLSRGYGRQSQFPARVDPNGNADEFGDEPLLIAREAGVPIYVAHRRYEAGIMAEAVQPASIQPAVHLLDDGFQHRQLHRDIDILLLNRQDWHDTLLPAGNLREPLQAARRATVIAIPADDPQFESELKTWDWQGPVWRLHRKMETPLVAGHILAFCGIARPDQFFAGLVTAGLQLSARIAFPDHHRYTGADLQRIARRAGKSGASSLITTEKDQVRLGSLASALPQSLSLRTALLRIEIENESETMEWLLERVVSTP